MMPLHNDPFAANETFVPIFRPKGTKRMSGAEFQKYRFEWVIFFSSVYGFQEHPGMNRENVIKKTIKECAAIADEMVLEIVERLERP